METIDMSPNWKFAAGIYMEVLKNAGASAEAKEVAEEEIMRMAAALDSHNEKVKEAA